MQPDMQQMLAQAQQLQEQLLAAQTEIAAAEVSGEAGGGLVTATVLGGSEVVALVIDPKAVDPQDVETLQDLVIGAINNALANAAQMAQETLGPLAQLSGGLGTLG
jgi:nucleoid-associated protein EbfC